jgi:glucose/arabinose dehydrogenase/PKD repeat protein
MGSKLLIALVVSAAAIADAAAQTPPKGFRDAVVLSGLTAPTVVRFSPDGRVFVAEKSGLIKVFDSLADTTPATFADLRINVHNYWDRGLLGLALDPGFPSVPYVYVLYTYDGTIGGPAPRWGVSGQADDGCPDPPGGTVNGCTVSGRLSRLQAAGNQMTGSEQVLVQGWFQQFPSHSMGSIAFGSDNALYASAGDGASWQFTDYGQKGNPGGDPPVPAGGTQTPPTAEGGSLRAQDLRSPGDPVGLNGSVIRVDRATGAALPDNPFYSSSDPNARRIIAYGFRNPFRITVRPGTRELWVGDVGWTIFDEIVRIPDPARTGMLNFGWPCYEGNARQPGWDAAGLQICEDLYVEPGAVTPPYFQYKQGAPIISGESCGFVDAAISGLAFYNGGSYPAKYNGALFFADYTRNCIWVMPKGGNGDPDPAQVATFLSGAQFPVDLQTGPGGDLFYPDFADGTIHQISYVGAAPVAVAMATRQTGRAPLTVTFDGSGSTDPDGSPLTYDWDLDGNGQFGDSTAAAPVKTFETNGTYTVSLKVTDDTNLSATASVVITVGNTPPAPIIDTPAAALRWRVGQAITFAGHAADDEDGALAAARLTWLLVMHHCSTETSCHEHDIQGYPGVSGGTFTAPDHEFPSHLELRLTATDSGGLTATTTLQLDPQTVTVAFNTTPSGLTVGLNAETVTGSMTRTMIVGSNSTISAPSPQTINGVTYVFSGWSDGGSQTHIITAGTAAATYTAVFKPGPPPAAASEVVVHAWRSTTGHGTWRLVADATAAGGARLEHPNAGAPKVPAPLAAPADYFELTFSAQQNQPYRLWMRGRAQANDYSNDSVYVQFSDSVTATGAPVFRIGSADATSVVIEDCSGCGLSGWGWADNAYGLNSLGPALYFATSGSHILRVQGREDGVSIDQIVLSPEKYRTASPGATKNDTTILPETATHDIVLYAAGAPVRKGMWRIVDDGTAAGGARVEHPDAGAPKVPTALASPADSFELTFDVEQGRPYRLWMRGRAQANSYSNDSVYAQFSGAVTSAGSAVYRVGTTDATSVIIEDCSGCGVSGWGWQDNGYGTNVLGPLIYFASTGPQTIRVQGREDGVSIDQIVLSPDTYLTTSPGTTKNDTTVLVRTP